MAHKALIEILGDAKSFLRAARETSGAAVTIEGDLKKLAVTARTSADAQIRASVQKDARLRAEISAYREVASAARKGSREQISAANLAEAAEKRLSRSMSVTVAEARKLERASAGRAGRGAVAAGAGAREHTHRLRGLASGALAGGAGLLAGGGIAYGIKDVVDAAIQAKAQEQQLEVAVKDAGLSFDGQRKQIDGALASQRALGFSQEESVQSLANLVRGTKDVATARQAQNLADNIARGRHVSLAIATNAVARAYGGQTGALRRLVPFIDKGASATSALKQAQQAYAGSAGKYAHSAAGDQARLAASLHHTEVVIGTELTPTVSRLSSHLAKWLNNSKNQARIQRDLHAAIKVVSTSAHTLFAIIKAGTPFVRGANRALGGTRNSVRLLVAAVAAFKISKLLDGLTGITGNAKTAKTEVGLLRTQLGLLAKIGTIVVVIEIIEHRKKIAGWLDKHNFLGARTVDKFVADHGGRGVLDAVYGDNTVSKNIGEPTSREKRLYKSAQLPGGKFQKGTRFAAEGGGKVIAFSPTGQQLGTLSTQTQAGKVAEIFSYYGLKAGQRALDKQTEAALEAKLIAVGYTKRRNYPIVGENSTHTKPTTKPTSTGGSTTGATDVDQQLKDNKLALASAKTRSQKLAALTDERRLLATQIASLKKQMQGATGVAKGLLEGDLTKAEAADTAAYGKIAALNRQGASAARAAASKARAAARAAAREHLQSVETSATRLQTAATGTKTVSATRKAFGALIAFYKREAHDTDLTRLEQARYAKLAVDAKLKLAKQIAADKKAAQKAVDTAQSEALGIGKGSSVSAVLARVKTAATDKQNGVPDIVGKNGTPTVRALKAQTDAVAKALKGTYLDTDQSRNLIARVRKVLSGQLGAVSAEMRGKLQALLSGLKGDLNNGVDGFNLSAADKRRRSLDKRYADHYGGQHGGRRHLDGSQYLLPKGLRGFGGSMTPGKLAPLQVHFHYSPKIEAIANEPVGHALDRGFFKMRVAMGAH